MWIGLFSMIGCADKWDMKDGCMKSTSSVNIHVVSKASGGIKTRSVDENTIRDIHILAYDRNGNLLGHGYGNGSTMTMRVPSGSGYKLYAIANTGDGSLFGGSTASTEEKLKSLTTGNLSFSADEAIKNGVLPMSGSLSDVTISDGETITGLAVERMVAKINVNVTAADGYTITGYSIKDLPKRSYYIARPNANEMEVGDLSVGDDAAFEGLNTATVSTSSINGLTFYMYENRRGDRVSINGSLGEIRDEQEKALYAPHNATYMEVYVHNGAYASIYRIYLGGDNSRNYNIKRNSEYNYDIHINSAGQTDSRVTQLALPSNSYIIAPQSHISIPVSRANEDGTRRIADVTQGWTAELLWTDNRGGVSSDGTSSIKSVKANLSAGTIDVTAGEAAGNAVIVAKVNGTIVWSWHLWVTDYNPEVSNISYDNGSKTTVFMDRNLGALNATAGSPGSSGLLYEWGRKDPFPGVGSTSFTTTPVSIYDANGTRLTESVSGSGVKYVSAGRGTNLENGIAHPLWYYYGIKSTSYDWLGRSHNDNLWNSPSSGKTVYDPCPTGWRVPQSGNGSSSPWYSWEGTMQGYTSLGFWSNGWNWTDADYALGWYAAAGYRKYSNGKLTNTGKNGCYWSATAYNNYVYAFTFNGLSVYPSMTSNQYRSYGCAVRCVKE